MAADGRVMVFQHGQRLCALPTAQVRSIRNEAPDAPGAVELCLWPSAERTPTGERWAELVVGGGTATYLRCGQPHIVELDRNATWPLSTLLSAVIGIPHLVGLSRTPHGDAWLVDLRYAEDAPREPIDPSH